MICVNCQMEIEGEVERCGCTVCNGSEGRIMLNGQMVGRIYKDTAFHSDGDSVTGGLLRGCIAALKGRIAELEKTNEHAHA